MSEIAIHIEKLGKRYRYGEVRPNANLRDDIIHWFRGWFRRNGGRHATLREVREQHKAESPEYFWALKDIDLEIKRGEIVGIVGRNGAGKSTLLKILSRITAPTTGRITYRGRVASLLEVGTGFHRDLTGRENVFLNGSILGMRRSEIARKFDEIVAFSEVEKFIDTPVKFYSSGMFVRLAFAVAAHLDPDILIVDEVLSVGDFAFQKKCLGKMGEVAGAGRTVLFVSHNMAAVTRLCKRGIWLENGTLREYADAEHIVAEYLAAGVQECGEIVFGDGPQKVPGSEYVRLESVRVRNSEERITAAIDIRRPFSIEVAYQILRPVSNLRIGLTLTLRDGTVVLNSTDMDACEGELERAPGFYVNRTTIAGDFLNCGQYFITIGSDFPMVQTHFLVDRVLSFHIEETGGAGSTATDRRDAILRMRLPWNIQKVG